MALRVGLGDYFYGLEFEFGNSMCITDDSIILVSLLDPTTKDYDGYAVIQRETGTVAAEFRYSRHMGGQAGIAAVKALTFAGTVANVAGAIVEVILDSFVLTTANLPQGTTAEQVMNEVYALMISQSVLDDFDVVLDVAQTSLIITTKTAGVDFPLDASSTDDATVEPWAMTLLTGPAGPNIVTDLTEDVIAGTNILAVTDVTGFFPGQRITLDPDNTSGFGSLDLIVQAVDDLNNLVNVDTNVSDAYPATTVVRALKGIPVDSVTNFAVGDDVTLVGATDSEVVRIKNIDLLTSEIFTETSLVHTYVADDVLQTLRQRTTLLDINTLVIVENQEEILANSPETDVICFDYSRADRSIYCFRRDSKSLLQLDPYNARTIPIGRPPLTNIAGTILDMHIVNNDLFILDNLNFVYQFNLDTGALIDKVSFHRRYTLVSMTGAQYSLHDRFADDETVGPENVHRLYLLCDDNTLLIYDLELQRIVLASAITSDAPVKAIDFYRTFQAADALDDESILKDATGTDTTDPYDVAFLFSLACGLSNGEFVNRWQYNLFKYVPTTIIMVSGNAIIVPNNTIAIYARGLSDHGEVVNDLPIKFQVAGNAGGTVTPSEFTFPARRDGWVPAIYKAAENPPIGSSDTITSIIIT